MMVTAGVSSGGNGGLSPNSALTVSGGTLDVTSGAQTIQSLTVGPGVAFEPDDREYPHRERQRHLRRALNLSGNAFGGEELLSYLAYSGSFPTSGIPYGYQLQ